jgi:transcriptional regulator with XRE-family HTH domain
MALSNWRKSKGWSQADLAARLGLRSKAQISGFETGVLAPKADIAIAIDRLSCGAVPVAELRPDLHDVRVIRPAHSGASA